MATNLLGLTLDDGGETPRPAIQRVALLGIVIDNGRKRLGGYEIIAPPGAGGTGDV